MNYRRKYKEERKEYDGHQCVLCGDGEDLEVHHIRPKTQGGKDDVRNLMTLCGFCHRFLHMMNPKVARAYSELTKKGLVKARERGVMLGRPKKCRRCNLQLSGNGDLCRCDLTPPDNPGEITEDKSEV